MAKRNNRFFPYLCPLYRINNVGWDIKYLHRGTLQKCYTISNSVVTLINHPLNSRLND